MPLTWRDVLDILLVGILFYYLWRLMAGTRALNLVRGVLVYLAVWFLASLTPFIPCTSLVLFP